MNETAVNLMMLKRKQILKLFELKWCKHEIISIFDRYLESSRILNDSYLEYKENDKDKRR